MRCGPGSLQRRTCCHCTARDVWEYAGYYTVSLRLTLLTVQLLGRSLQIGLRALCPARSTAKGGSRSRLPRLQGRGTSPASYLPYWREVACATTEFEPGDSIALYDQPPQGVKLAHIGRMVLAWCLYWHHVSRVKPKLPEVGDRRHSHRTRGGISSYCLSPNPPKDTEGWREDSGRGVRELQGRWPGLHWGRWEVGGRSSVAAQGPYGRLRELRCAGWRENTQQGTLADRGGASLRGRWVSCRLAVRPGVEWLAAGPRRE